MANKVSDKAGTFLLNKKEKKRVEAVFSRHINAGQVKYLKAGHLDLIEVERDGIYFIDAATGKRFIDCFSSAGSFNVGRHNPEILKALDTALASLDMGRHNLVSPQKVALAKKLTEIAPGDLNRVFFAAGGGDAVDGAIKLARGATGRSQVISTVKAYHGHTGFALSANGKEHYRGYCEPLIPDFDFAPFNDLEAIKALASEKTAAIILEPIQGEAGIFVGSDEYLRGLRELCDQLGIILIFDEIQTGWGRTGKLFACEHSGVVPDIMCVAKSMAGGLFPNAAVLYRDTGQLTEFVESNFDFHPSYTGGSDLGCANSLAVIEFIEKNNLCENSAKMGEKLKNALEQLKEENPKIVKEVRGRGLMIGIEYIHEFMGPMMSDALAKNGVFAAYSGNAPQVMRFMLPIVVTDEEMNQVIEAIRAAVKSMKPLLFFAVPVAKIGPVLRALNSEKVQTVLFGWIRKIGDIFTRS
jgi:acetylornithine/succinyldiaminopimelate/putrescine aminotransferase